MNKKRLLAAVIAVTMGASGAAAFSACNKHTHEYSDWTVTAPATCTEDGVETGTCKADGATTTRPVQKLGHSYGDWQIAPPTATEAGTATKTCANDTQNAHPINVNLPALGGGAYQSEKLSETPTYTKYKYTLAHTEGAIEFTAYEEKENVALTVAEAVVTANDTRYSSLVGSGEGKRGSTLYLEGFSYEYGENYTHIKDVNGEYWLQKVDGVISGIYKDYDYNWIKDAQKVYYDGIILSSPVGDEDCCGAEKLLETLYSAAKGETVEYDTEFSESVENGKYTFSFTSLYNTSYLMHAVVEFTLDESYMLKTLDFTGNVYDSGTFEFDETALKYVLNAGAEVYSTQKFTVEQTALSDVETVPVYPWNHDELKITSFKLGQGEVVKQEEYEAIPDTDPDYVKYFKEGYGGGEHVLIKKFATGGNIKMTTAEATRIYVMDALPESASEYASLNPVKVYLVKDNGDEEALYDPSVYKYGNEQLGVFFDTQTVDDVIYSYVIIKCLNDVGEYNIKVCVGEAEADFTLKVEEGEPQGIATTVKVYNENKDGYDVKKSDTANVYVGQNLGFALTAEYGAFDEHYAADLSAVVTLPDGTENATVTETDGVYSFVATAAGEYKINIKSVYYNPDDIRDSRNITLTVTVEEIPDLSASLSGEYKAGKFTVSFADGNLTVSDGATVNETFAYTYTDGVLTAASSNGDYSVTLTENYKLVLLYNEFNQTNRELLKSNSGGIDLNAVKAALVGAWKGLFTDGYGDNYNITITFNADGTAEFDDTMGPSATTLTYRLEDNGDGTCGIIFGDGAYSGYFAVNAVGSSLSFDGTTVSNVTFSIYDLMDETYVDNINAVKQ